MSADLAPLFRPFECKSLKLRNRVAMAPMTRNFSPGQVPTEEVAGYYRRRAEGEVGLRTFFERYPTARLAGAGSRRDTRVLRGWSTLPITLGKAPAKLVS